MRLLAATLIVLVVAGCGQSAAGCEQAVGAVRLFIEEANGIAELIDEAERDGDADRAAALQDERDRVGREVALVVDERPRCFDEEMRVIAEVLLESTAGEDASESTE